jgi:hypothetical protein
VGDEDDNDDYKGFLKDELRVILGKLDLADENDIRGATMWRTYTGTQDFVCLGCDKRTRSYMHWKKIEE